MLASRTGLLQQSGVRSNFVAFSAARRVAPLAAVRRTATIVCAADDAVAVQAPAPVQTGPKEGRCYLPFQRGSPFKVRRVLDVIRGRPYEEALVLLEYMPYKACERIIKVLMSAAANAKNNNGASKSNLIVKECFADGGPCYKRVRPRAQGRGGKILKPTYHLTVRVEEKTA